MHALFAQSELSDLVEKVENDERLGFDAGVRMMNSQDLLALGYMANVVRERKNGNNTYFMVNNPINHTNVCTDRLNATMIYGHVARPEDRIDHLIQLRALQDRKSEFLAFIPLPCDPKNTQFEGIMGVKNTTGFEDLKMFALSRILLDNFDHIKAFWMMLGPKLAQVSQAFGVDDLDGIVVEEAIVSSAEAETNLGMSKRALIHMIKTAGRDAVERDILYRVLRTH
ncbi:FO synthase [Desulfosporosinus sp. OT]|uniref:FO synthase n=1 Tax=Desulfosporosinus sp. OT TaxID=913865 RepID=UPI000223AF39|nr:FO synthase [Desulfosporosinus sp. OT]EGW38217.1 FO synthase subunit 2 [Desulfosporosinus sp. OT]